MQLSGEKAFCTTAVARPHGHGSSREPDSAVPDDWVDSDRGRTGAVAFTGGIEVAARTPDYCSTLQTELMAIELALEHVHYY